MKTIKIKERKRRKVQKQIDSQPTFNHQLSFYFTKPYIKNKSVLDVGCWTGQYEMLAKDYVKKIVGIDPGKEAIKLAKKNFSKYRNVTFKIGKVEKLEFKDNKFDTVTMIEVLEHLPQDTEIQALKEVNRVLKPGGHLILSTPNQNIFSILFDPAYFLIGHRHYSLKQLSKFLKKINFQILKVQFIGGFAHLIVSNVEMIFKHILKRKFNRPRWLNRKIEKEYKSGGFSGMMILAQSRKTSSNPMAKL